jgi:uncharacterized protein (TIGR04255 family)
MNSTDVLPYYDPVPLERSPLVLSVAQIQFPAIMAIATDDTFIAQFQERVRNFYPFLKVGHQAGFSLSGGGIQPQQLSTRFFQFTDSERLWTVTLATNAVSLEARRYTDIEEFVDRLSKILAAVKDIYSVSIRERAGLRYINEIRYPDADTPSDWRPLIRNQLLGPLSDESISRNAVAMSQELVLDIPDGNLAIRHGFFPQGNAVAPIPGTDQPAGPFYLFDLDAYDESSKDMDEGTLEELFRSYNSVQYSLFRWGLEQRLFSYLKGSDD